MRHLWLGMLRDEDGATAIEYSLIAALISLAILAGMQGIGLELGDMFTKIADALAWGSNFNGAP